MMRVSAFDHIEQRTLESLGEVIEVVIKIADLGVFPLQHHLHVQVSQAPTISFEPARWRSHPAPPILHPQLAPKSTRLSLKHQPTVEEGAYGSKECMALSLELKLSTQSRLLKAPA